MLANCINLTHQQQEERQHISNSLAEQTQLESYIKQLEQDLEENKQKLDDCDNQLHNLQNIHENAVTHLETELKDKSKALIASQNVRN